MKYLRKFATEAEYKIFAQSDAYEKPNISFVEETSSVKYEVVKGVFIQHINGILYTTAEWETNGFASEDANGVAVRNVGVDFVIAKTQASDSMAWASSNDIKIQEVGYYLQQADAVSDVFGKENTDAMVAAGVAESGAVHFCINYTFPNGKKGYLPSVGEWNIAYEFHDEVNAALALISASAIDRTTYSSSTQSDSKKIWVLTWYNGALYSYNKSGSEKVRAFTTL